MRGVHGKGEWGSRAVAVRAGACLVAAALLMPWSTLACDDAPAAADAIRPLERSDFKFDGDGLAGMPSPVREAIEAFIEAIAGRDDAPLIHRLSIDDDPDAFDAALAAHPSGICTDAFEEDFVVDAVPKYYMIREGKLVEQGIAHEKRVAAWRQTWAP